MKVGDVVVYKANEVGEPNTPDMNGAIGVLQQGNGHTGYWMVGWIVCPAPRFMRASFNAWNKANLHLLRDYEAVQGIE